MRLVSTPEYDAFGPWVLPVSSRDQIPPVFQAHSIDFTRAHDVLKVPRDVERRDATPRSHLYDFLLVLGDDGLEVLARQGHRFTVQRVRRQDVAAVESGAELLQGRFAVLGTDGTRIEVGFNGSSLPVITAFADRLLGWEEAAQPRSPRAMLDRNVLGERDVGLVNGYNAVPGDASRRVAVAYGGRTPGSQQSRVVRLLRGPARVSGAVVGVDERYAVVSTRAAWVRQSRKPDLSARRIVVRRAAVTAVSGAPHPILDGIVELRVACGAPRIDLAVPDDQVAAVTAALRATAASPGAP